MSGGSGHFIWKYRTFCLLSGGAGLSLFLLEQNCLGFGGARLVLFPGCSRTAAEVTLSLVEQYCLCI